MKDDTMLLDNLVDVPVSYYGTEIKDVSIQLLGLEETVAMGVREISQETSCV